jgi:tRNA (cytosine49-C5)-methyltransferase
MQDPNRTLLVTADIMISRFEWYREIIPDYQGFLESVMRPMPVHLRINSLKTEPLKLLSMLRSKNIYLKASLEGNSCFLEAPLLKSPGNLMEYLIGYIHPQALTSCLASVALSPEPSSYVLDMCAAPGGKTSHLAQVMNNSGLIVANEPYHTRHIPLVHTLSRLGVLNAVLTSYQAQEFPLNQQFDYVLADVPCTGEGRIRYAGNTGDEARRSKIMRRQNLSEIQKKIILRGCDLLKPGGEMLYSTCTYNPEENESIVNFLLQNREATLLPIQVGFDYEQGLTQWRDEKYDKQLERTARFYPHRINSVGFFMARIRKGRKA